MTNEGRRELCYLERVPIVIVKSEFWDVLAQPLSIFVIFGKLLNCLSLISLYVNWSK